jgi:hypothetical protein
MQCTLKRALGGCFQDTLSRRNRRLNVIAQVLTLKSDNRAYTLSRQQAELLIYKLSAMASGAFSREIDYLGAGKEWLPDASRLADSLYLALHDSIDVSIELDRARGFALYQVLRVTYTGRPPNALTSLYESLERRYR